MQGKALTDAHRVAGLEGRDAGVPGKKGASLRTLRRPGLGTERAGAADRKARPRLREVAPNIWRMRVPLIAGIDHSNVYLIRDNGSWCTFDTGIGTDEVKAIWSAALAGPLKEGLSRIIVSHHHPDHLGLASWLQEKTGAAVLVRPEELDAARTASLADSSREEIVRGFFAAHGMPGEDLERFMEVSMKTFYACEIPRQTESPSHGQCLSIGRRRFEVLIAGGHSVAQVALYDPSDRVLLSGDQLLEKITPNVGLWPYGDPSPLRNHFGGLDELSRRDIRTVMPAHREVYGNGDRVEELRSHHRRMLSLFRERLDRAMTAQELALSVYGKRRDVDNRVLALVETLAHLQWLHSQGIVVRAGEGTTHWLRG